MPDDLKYLSYEELDMLCKELRTFLIENISKTGGHLASNLGVVELTVALHRCFDTSTDRIVWDVGHQTYIHKILTGRKDLFHSIRQFEGISGFPKTRESIHDAFNTGHSSTSISAALGMARARDIQEDDYRVIAVIGDGSITNGMALEAINDAGSCKTDLIVILNDNEMSIAKNVGGFSNYFARLANGNWYYKIKKKLKKILPKVPFIGRGMLKVFQKIRDIIKIFILPGNVFVELGFKYIELVDGHDIRELEKVFSNIKDIEGPIIVHVCTQKGKGYLPAEKNPDMFHGIAPFKIETGEVFRGVDSILRKSFTQAFGEKLLEIGRKNDKIVAITAAMMKGTGVNIFACEFPERTFDVGIAEEHAVTMAGGFAISGMIPIVAIYSTFLQRAYDQIMHDIAFQNLHVVFALDRAGIVGEDGETHHGIYDLSFLDTIPNIQILAPADHIELAMMLDYAVNECDGPVAIRYPRGSAGTVAEQAKKMGIEQIEDCYKEIKYGKGVLLESGKDVTIVAEGAMIEKALEVSAVLGQSEIFADVINVRSIKPLDSALILNSYRRTGKIVSIENNVAPGGLGSKILKLISEKTSGDADTVIVFAFPDEPISQGNISEIFDKYGMSTKKIVERIIDWR
jgi:1-deoxy-D-xylulose-5-phosphate synthase